MNKKRINYSSLKVEVKQISIGELHEMFRSGKIKITHRSKAHSWSDEQKSSFIEMLMVGIPMPSVYLYFNSSTNCWTNMGVNIRLEILKQYIENSFAISKTGSIIDSSSGMTYQSLSFQDRVSLNSMTVTINFISGINNKTELKELQIINSHHL